MLGVIAQEATGLEGRGQGVEVARFEGGEVFGPNADHSFNFVECPATGLAGRAQGCAECFKHVDRLSLFGRMHKRGKE